MAQKGCPNCGGSGKIERYCPTCHGSGQASSSYDTTSADGRCNTCYGQGRTTESCSTCGGSGYIDDGRSDSDSSSSYSSSSPSSTPSSSGGGGAYKDPPDVIIQQARILIKTERYEQAITFLTQAINHPHCRDSDKSIAYSFRGYCYLQNGKTKKAIEDCNNAISINSNEASAYLHRGLTYDYWGGRKELATADLKKAADLDPKGYGELALKKLASYGIQYTPKKA